MASFAALWAYPGLHECWFPIGRRHGRKYRFSNLYGDAPKSLSINDQSGSWKDFTNGSFVIPVRARAGGCSGP